MLNPKAQCKACLAYWDVGIVYCTCGTSCEMERRRTRNSSSTLLTSFRCPITTSRKGEPTGTATGRSREITSTSSRIRSRRNARRERFLGFHDRFIRDERFRKNMIELGRNEEYVVRLTNWRTKTTRTTSLQMKFEYIETICGYVPILLVPTRCP